MAEASLLVGMDRSAPPAVQAWDVEHVPESSKLELGDTLRAAPPIIITAPSIQNPLAADETTAMPNLNVTPGDAQDIASYLNTLD
jgi:hypothetical protein